VPPPLALPLQPPNRAAEIGPIIARRLDLVRVIELGEQISMALERAIEFGVRSASAPTRSIVGASLASAATCGAATRRYSAVTANSPVAGSRTPSTMKSRPGA
jgi:hypothetical protein